MRRWFPCTLKIPSLSTGLISSCFVFCSPSLRLLTVQLNRFRLERCEGGRRKLDLIGLLLCGCFFRISVSQEEWPVTSILTFYLNLGGSEKRSCIFWRIGCLLLLNSHPGCLNKVPKSFRWFNSNKGQRVGAGWLIYHGLDFSWIFRFNGSWCLGGGCLGATTRTR